MQVLTELGLSREQVFGLKVIYNNKVEAQHWHRDFLDKPEKIKEGLLSCSVIIALMVGGSGPLYICITTCTSIFQHLESFEAEYTGLRWA
jgi:hypothetical protein